MRHLFTEKLAAALSMNSQEETVLVESSSLAQRLRERIRREGAITFREWMYAALYDEREGYYRRRGLARWGRAGDYRTAPERTPLFAATFARQFAALHVELGQPNDLTVIEAGAGAGHFASVLIRTLRRDHPRLFSALRYVIDETSEDAMARAAELLAPFRDRVEFRRLREIKQPSGACIVFSNELLDAFPVHRVVMREGRLRELCVGVNERGAFAWSEREPSTPLLAEYLKDDSVALVEGQFAEINLDACAWLARAASSFERGYLITVDYGAEAAELFGAPHRRAGTLRAFAAHQLAENPLAHPGEQDLTTTVDWTRMKLCGERAGLETVSLERLDKFLLRAGVLEQLEHETELAETEAERAQLSLGARELILPGGMCESFQILIQAK